MTPKDMMTQDALEASIEFAHTNIKLKRYLTWSICLNVFLVGLLLFFI